MTLFDFSALGFAPGEVGVVTGAASGIGRSTALMLARTGIAGYMRHVAVKFRGQPRANAVAPGPTVTPRTSAMFASPSMQERLKGDPLGRPAEADEIAAVICFLLSPAASFVNGVLLPVDGASICAPG